jgi:histidinol-phosphate/aromatic aminotransferase/cobyric acid decarboxylase-like protein
MAEPTSTVYSFYAPEVKSVVREGMLKLNTGIAVGTASIHSLLKQNVDPGLDELHLPLMMKYERFARSEGVIGLESFKNKYFTNGSSEAIFHLLAELRTLSDYGVPLYQFDGEYQGYWEYAEALDLPIQVISPEDLGNVPTGIVILSNPASKDGNIVDPNLLTTILRRHEVILDLAYMGMTIQPLNIDVTRPGIRAVVGSLSKPFGLYYYRIGFCYTRESVASLYGNKWFKNALSIKIGEAVLDHFGDPKKMASFKGNYFIQQERAVDAINSLYFKDWHATRQARASDVWLLANAYLGEIDTKELDPFKRGKQNYRFCLTPYYLEAR